jgi:GNAT superfamily N-acetyltransferase
MTTRDALGQPPRGRPWLSVEDLPSMVDVREAGAGDAAAVARVHVESWKTAYRGLLPDEVVSRFTYEEQATKWATLLGDPKPGEFTLVAVQEPEGIVGFASAGPERKGLSEYEGELYSLYLLHCHRGQGIGTQLFGSVVAMFRQARVGSMAVWVLADNPHRRFYVKMGGQHVARGQQAIDGKDYATLAYGWKGLTE